jgi:hypothetical protein
VCVGFEGENMTEAGFFTHAKPPGLFTITTGLQQSECQLTIISHAEPAIGQLQVVLDLCTKK